MDGVIEFLSAELFEPDRGVSDSERQEIKLWQAQAIAYAWGRGDERGADAVDSWRFGQYAGCLKARFVMHETTFLNNIRDQYDRYLRLVQPYKDQEGVLMIRLTEEAIEWLAEQPIEEQRKLILHQKRLILRLREQTVEIKHTIEAERKRLEIMEGIAAASLTRIEGGAK